MPKPAQIVLALVDIYTNETIFERSVSSIPPTPHCIYIDGGKDEHGNPTTIKYSIEMDVPIWHFFNDDEELHVVYFVAVDDNESDASDDIEIPEGSTPQ